MKVLFDTSVIVAGSVVGHAEEARARAWFEAARDERIEGCVTSHGLAEVWATLTAIPVEPRVAPSMACRLIERLCRHIRPVALTWQDYGAAMDRCADRSLRSGAIYDALHVVAAERVGAALLLTFNVDHFKQLQGSSGPRVLAPPEPPDVEKTLRASTTGRGRRPR